MAYRDDLIALSARHDALAEEIARKTRELEDAQHLLEQARARARLPVLDHIGVASPCSADWNAMIGDDRTRYCGDCKKHVYNLSGMTRDEAEALVTERNGDLCVRYFQRADGTILLADCTIGASRRRRRRWVAAGAAALLASGAAATGLALHRDEPVQELLGQTQGMRTVLVDPAPEADPAPAFAPTTPTTPTVLDSPAAPTAPAQDAPVRVKMGRFVRTD
ncbi:MAG TPA: hypothetical protein VFT22_30045 [Kofleriaceae bacterium]|nr:hypothetical protein [Kofleriaceae bacterium]